jgi:hypothetical protein
MAAPFLLLNSSNRLRSLPYSRVAECCARSVDELPTAGIPGESMKMMIIVFVNEFPG